GLRMSLTILGNEFIIIINYFVLILRPEFTIFWAIFITSFLTFNTCAAKGSGILNITGGTGMFKNATGTLTFVQEDTVNLGPTTILNGVALVNGYITVPQSVPEPTNITPLIGLALTGVGFFRYLFPN
ncbi:hypothetical protein ACE1AD_12030, partial [Umezakia sp. BLCC-F215]